MKSSVINVFSVLGILCVLVLIGTVLMSVPANSEDVVLRTYTTHTTYTGRINGEEVCGSGIGTLNVTEGESGESINNIPFSAFPGGFSPLYGKSWKCKHHPLIVPFPGDYNIETVLIYTNAATGTIHTTGQVIQDGDTSTCTSTWNGAYSGPTETPEDIEFWELISPTQEAGVYEISGYRKMLVPENQFVECSWTGTLTLLSGTGPDNPVLLSYEWLSKSWNPETGEFFKHVLVNVSEPGTITPQP